jgi:hypothetical protein
VISAKSGASRFALAIFHFALLPFPVSAAGVRLVLVRRLPEADNGFRGKESSWGAAIPIWEPVAVGWVA